MDLYPAKTRAAGDGKSMTNIIGVIGVLCVVWGLFGVFRYPAKERIRDKQPSVQQPTEPQRSKVPINPRSLATDSHEQANEHGSIAEVSYYPLEVGRYWVYEYEDEANRATVEIVRTINGRERRDGKELFFFDDGTVAYADDGKVFEMGAEGGVNVIPVDADSTPTPYVYTSEDMLIHKEVGARDTSVVLGGQRFTGCLEIITKFESAKTDDRRRAISYSSFYAPHIGLVGREGWPERDMSLVLTRHGSRQPGLSTPISKAL
jgi:hypothetical protein